MAAEKHVVVIGAGIVGASVAWHLAWAGARVTIVDAGAPGGVATAASFAWINASWGNPEPYVRLRTRAMAEWSRLAAECPGIALSWCGGLHWDMPDDDLDAYVARSRPGYEVRSVGRVEIEAIEPGLADPPARAVHVVAEGMVEPVAAATAMVADAVRRGAVMRRDLVVRGVSFAGGQVGIDTSAGRLDADAVVVAAGIASPELLAGVGYDLPLVTPAGLLAHSLPHARLLNGLVMGPRAHIRQTADGRLVAGADFGGTEPGDDAEARAHRLIETMRAMLKGADAVAFDRYTIGRRPTPKDGFPVVGPAAPGAFAAVMHSGVTLAPAVGLFLADEILSGRSEPLLAAYRPSRFV